MTTNSSDDNNNKNDDQLEIPLKLPKVAEDSEIIQKFVIDPYDQFVKLRLNSMYNPQISIDVPIRMIKEKDGWTKFLDKFKNLKKTFTNLQNDHNIWIYAIINENGSLIRTHLMQNQKHHQQQSDHHFKEKEQEDEEEQQNQESTTEEIHFSEWAIKLVEKYTNLQKEILYLIPELWEPTEFALSVGLILRIKNITLPFGGIVLGPSSSLKSATVELFRNTKDTRSLA